MKWSNLNNLIATGSADNSIQIFEENANANANESGSSGGPAELNRGRRVINTYFHVPATMAPPPESDEAPEWESLDALLLHLRTQV